MRTPNMIYWVNKWMFTAKHRAQRYCLAVGIPITDIKTFRLDA